jgi:hypothetical protein
VDSAIEALDFETKPPQKVASARLGRLALEWRRSPGAEMNPTLTCLERI